MACSACVAQACGPIAAARVASGISTLSGEPSDGGLPIGIQLIAEFGRDDALLALGAAVEAASLRPAPSRWPP